MTSPNATKCPPEAILSDFGLGKLDAASAETIGQHLETCTDCRNRVASLPGDTFVGRLRQAGGTAKPVKRERMFVPGESLANAANSTDGAEDGLPRPSRPPRAQTSRDELESPSSTSAPPELANHPDYELIKELGQGGMGTVYLAKNRMMDRLEVLKVISKSLLDRPGALERFQQEIRSAAKLQHTNIVAAYSVLRPGDLLVFAMEYVKGQDLAEVVKARGNLPVANAAFYIHQVANGLQHAHEKGMVHRDIKPNNLMLAIEGKKHTVKILDFGLAKATSEEGAETGLTKSGQMLGTPDYVAPEQTLDAHNADIRADIYSLGCTLYFLLSGGPPFQETSLYAILEAHHKRDPKPLNLVRPEVPVELAQVVAKMMAKDPAKRFQTPSEVAKALVPFFKPGQSIGTSPSAGKPREEEEYPQFSMETAPRPLSATPPSLAGQPPPLPVAIAPLPLPAAPVAIVALPPPAEELSVSIDTHRVIEKRRRGWSSLPPWQRWTAVGGGAALVLSAAVFFLQTKSGAIRVEINDPRIEVAIKGSDIVLKQADNGHDVKLSPGEKTLVVERGDFKFETDRLTLNKGEVVTVAVTLLDGEIAVRHGKKVVGLGKLTASEDASTRSALVLNDGPPENARSSVPVGTPSKAESVRVSKRFPFEIRDPYQSRWRLDGDELVQSATVPNNILFGDPNWADFDCSLEVKLDSAKEGCGIQWHYEDSGDHEIYWAAGYGNSLFRVDLMKAGEATTPASHKGTLTAGEWHRLAVRVRGTRRQCFLDGEEILAFETEKRTHGRLGLAAWTSTYRVRNILVQSPDGSLLLEGLPDLDAEPPAQPYQDDYKNVLAARGGTPPVGADGQVLNLDFETGNLQGWRVNGDAFAGQPVRGDTLHAHYRYLQSRHSGEFWIDGMQTKSDSAKGTLTSPPFKITKPYASFLMAGARPDGGDVAVELVERDASEPFLRVAGNGSDSLQPVSLDLTQHLGKEIAVRLVDRADGPAGHVSFDDFRLHDSMPDFSPASVRANAITIGATTDVLKLVDIKRDCLAGAWYRDAQNRLAAQSWEWKVLQLPVVATVEYDLAFTAEGFPRVGAMYVVLPVNGRQVQLVLDAQNKDYSGLNSVDGKPANQNESMHCGAVLLDGRPNELVCQVRAGAVRILSNGKTIVDWRGDAQRLSLPWGKVAGWDRIVIAGVANAFRISQIDLTPIGVGSAGGDARPAEEPGPKLAAPDAPLPTVSPMATEPPRAVAPFNAKQARAHQRAWAKHLGVAIEQTNLIGMKLVLIPPGEFTMGSTPEQVAAAKAMAEQLNEKLDQWMLDRLDEEMPPHRVTITRPFLVGPAEVTVGQFRSFVDASRYITDAERYGGGNSGSMDQKDANKKQLTWRAPGHAVADHSNVSQVSWYDAVAFCNWLSEAEKLTPCYKLDDKARSLRDRWLLDSSGTGYRLPTDAEWEYACRAGTTTQFSFGDDPMKFPQYGWKRRFGPIPRPSAVAGKLPNAFGLYDMHGGVFEWCHDWYGRDYYAKSPAADPTGPASPFGGWRVRRGGGYSWVPLVYCRSAYRAPSGPFARDDDTGFRVVRASTVIARSKVPTRMWQSRSKPVTE